MSVPVYVAEAAPAHIRGALVTLNQLFITIGILISSLVAGAFSTDKENGWRLVFPYIKFWMDSLFYLIYLAGFPWLTTYLSNSENKESLGLDFIQKFKNIF